MTTPHRTLLQQALEALTVIGMNYAISYKHWPQADAAITALREALAADHLRDVAEKVGPAAPVPDGWVMVPKEATREMCVAAVVLNNGNAVYKNVAAEALEIEEQIYGEVWSAMIAASPAAPAAPVVREPVIDEMDAVASKYAHKMALDLECVLSDYSGKWWDTAMQTIGAYRSAMNAIHERESPTHMGEPVLPRKNCDRPDCPAGGYGPCAQCEREHSGG